MDLLLAEVPASDWNTLFHCAVFLHRNGQHERALSVAAQAMTSFSADLDARGLAPDSEEWLWPVSKMLAAIGNLGQHDAVISFVEGAGLAAFDKPERQPRRHDPVCSALFSYEMALRRAGRMDDAAAVRVMIARLFEASRNHRQIDVFLRMSQIYDTWWRESFRDAEPMIADFLRLHPADPDYADLLRVLLAVARCHDHDWDGALEALGPELGIAPLAPGRSRRDATVQENNARYIRGWVGVKQGGDVPANYRVMEQANSAESIRIMLNAGMVRR